MYMGIPFVFLLVSAQREGIRGRGKTKVSL